MQKIELRTSREVNNCVLWSFKHINDLIGFTLLEADQSGKLQPSQNQEPNT